LYIQPNREFQTRFKKKFFFVLFNYKMCLGIDPELGSDVDSLGWLAGDIDLGGYETWTTT